jgi:hypothetical protein
MDNPRKGRVEERHFLNLPGFNAGAYVLAYVEDTSEKELRLPTAQKPDTCWAPCPRLSLEIADCENRTHLYFDIEDADDRLNSFHKIDTLITALQAFRVGMAEEVTLRRQRLREIERARVIARGDGAPASTSGLRAVS